MTRDAITDLEAAQAAVGATADKRTRLGSLGRRNTVSRSHVRLIHPPYNWADEDFEIKEREARDDLENAIQEERERREEREATWPW